MPEPTVPDFEGYQRPGIYLVFLSEDGFTAMLVEDGKVWDSEDGPDDYPDLWRDVNVIAERNRTSIEETASVLPED